MDKPNGLTLAGVAGLVIPLARWPGGPAICAAANLPAFHSLHDLKAFYADIPGVDVDAVWRCSSCGLIHAHGHLNGSPVDTLRIPETVKAHNAELSKRDSFLFNEDHPITRIDYDDTPKRRRNTTHRKNPPGHGPEHYAAHAAR